MKKTAVKKTAAKKKSPAASRTVKPISVKTDDLTAEAFLRQLESFSSAAGREKIRRYFKTENDEADVFAGVRMGQVFAIAKSFMGMPIAEMEKLLESPVHEARAGAVSIMDKESRNKKISESRLKELYTLYMKRHDRINNWDLVDLGCLYMVGLYLFDKPRKILYTLARSANSWERRTAIVGTCYFIRQRDVNDTFAIAELLLRDKEDLVHKGAGWMLRFAGDKNPAMLLQFLDKHAAAMPRTMLRYSIEKLNPKLKKQYMEMKPESKK